LTGDKIPKLSHRDKKESTWKWLIIAAIPVVNLYYLWKIAEMVSGHKTEISGEYMTLEHRKEKESTGKWFAILLLPAIIMVVGGLTVLAGGLSGTAAGIAGGLFGMFISFIVAPLAALYLLYKVSVPVSGHEKKYDGKERMDHMGKKESTVKWMMFGLTGALTIYFLWRSSQMISGHEVV